MEDGYLIDVNVGTCDQLEQRKICILAVTKREQWCLLYNMTWLLASVSCNIPGNLEDKHHQMFFHSKIMLCVSDNDEIPAIIHHYLSR